MEEDDTNSIPPAKAPASTPDTVEAPEVDSVTVSESMSILQKGLFLAFISGCVAVYLRLSKVKDEDVQGYEKSLA
jgi:hypothetical protein